MFNGSIDTMVIKVHAAACACLFLTAGAMMGALLAPGLFIVFQLAFHFQDFAQCLIYAYGGGSAGAWTIEEVVRAFYLAGVAGGILGGLGGWAVWQGYYRHLRRSEEP